jgi:glutamyl-tRNA synthetase
LRDELYYALFDDLGLQRPNLVEISRLQIKNAPLSKRLLKPLVEQKKVMGWDDPRLPTLKGLERRGIQPAALREFVLSFGLSKVESEPTWEALLSQNRKLLDPQSPHYFFVPDPVELEIKGLESRTIILRKHPKKDLGERSIKVGGKLLIPGSDAKLLKDGEVFRLKDLCNVKLGPLGSRSKKTKGLTGDILPDEMVEKKIQWVSGIDAVDCEVLVPKDLLDEKGEYDPKSLEIVEGRCERSCSDLETGTIVQFERFGFCRLDRKETGRLIFVFTC